MEELLFFVNLVCLVIAVMLIWFKTNAYVEYCKLFGLTKMLIGYNNDSNDLTFPQYLYIKSNTLTKCSICKFIIALITCPLCICFWLSLGAASLSGAFLLTPIYYVSSLIGFLLIERLLN